MKTGIATVSIAGDFATKLEAIAAEHPTPFHLYRSD